MARTPGPKSRACPPSPGRGRVPSTPGSHPVLSPVTSGQLCPASPAQLLGKQLSEKRGCSQLLITMSDVCWPQTPSLGTSEWGQRGRQGDG